MKITITDIAEIAGVSVATVSRVINNKSKGVSDATRERIWKIIEENNYQPSAIARGLVTKKSKIIGLLIPDITNPFFPQIAKGVEDAAAEKGYNVILCDGENKPSKELSHLDFLSEHYVSGVVYSNNIEISEETYEQIKKRQMKTVFVDSYTTSEKVYSVQIDNIKAMKEVIDYLYDNGHRRIAFIGGEESAYSSMERLSGYKAALDDHNITFDPDLVAHGEYKISSARKVIKELVSRNTNFTAVFCCENISSHISIMGYGGDVTKRSTLSSESSFICFESEYMV